MRRTRNSAAAGRTAGGLGLAGGLGMASSFRFFTARDSPIRRMRKLESKGWKETPVLTGARARVPWDLACLTPEAAGSLVRDAGANGPGRGEGRCGLAQ